eukprot:CAMPEP_0171247004 /NCGR_PEP_ID=MMETSP0790-20130122/48266_1 /TAXON_ID=2925 /ORGANISM="Alexandrium catenella, Strain OF101" /LENGTH=110 /DNA_ID=CAMNT_0011714389 /DNA_START=175 /DNA_END=503 /DNA_ORIENTATION=+
MPLQSTHIDQLHDLAVEQADVVDVPEDLHPATSQVLVALALVPDAPGELCVGEGVPVAHGVELQPELPHALRGELRGVLGHAREDLRALRAEPHRHAEPAPGDVRKRGDP